MRQNLFNRILLNTAHPRGYWGRVILRCMNLFHSPLAIRGLALIKWEETWDVLDIGCGGGRNLQRLLRLCPKGRIYGIDKSKESIAFSRRLNSKNLNRRCFVRLGDVCSLPYTEGYFDAVTAFESVYFWDPIKTALDEVFRVLRKDGYFLISIEACNPEAGKKWTERIPGMTIFSPDKIEKMLQDTGFRDIKIHVTKNEAQIISRKP